MSCDIRIYKCNDKNCTDDLTLTACVGIKGDSSIQFTIGREYVVLDSEALLDLMGVIIHRINRDTGYRATESEREDLEYKI